MGEEIEKPSLAPRGDLPVYGDALETFVETFAAHSIIEIAPAGAFAEGGQEIVVGFVEVEVIVLVKEDGLVVIALEPADLLDHFSNAVGVADAVAVEKEEIGALGDVVGRDLAAGEGSRDEKFFAGALLDALDQFVGSVGFEQRARIADVVGFVGDFDQDVAVVPGEEPIGSVVGAFENRFISCEAVLLAKIEEAENGGHSQLVGLVQDLFETIHVVGAKVTVVGER